MHDNLQNLGFMTLNPSKTLKTQPWAPFALPHLGSLSYEKRLGLEGLINPARVGPANKVEAEVE